MWFRYDTDMSRAQTEKKNPYRTNFYENGTQRRTQNYLRGSYESPYSKAVLKNDLSRISRSRIGNEIYSQNN